jgi:hypothetical protein
LRILVYGCVVIGSLLLGWALSNLVAWWLVPSWHVNREPIIVAFFLLLPATPCVLLAPALAIANRRKWPHRVLFASAFVFALAIVTVLVFWFTNLSPT